MKKLIATLMAIGALGATAETYTWKGGEGTWQTESNWDPEGLPGGDDSVVISDGVVEYVPGGDLIRNPGTTMTITNAKLVQTTDISWPNIKGTVTLGEGGEWDFGTATGCNWDSTGKIVLDGGVLRYWDTTISATDLTEKFQLNSGTLIVRDGKEIQPSTATYENMHFVCHTFAPTTESVITFKSGSITTARGDNAGVWQNGAAYINVLSGGDFAHTFVGTVETAYAMTFGTTKFKYDGVSLDAAKFAEAFEVVDNDNDTVTVKTRKIEGWVLAAPTVNREGTTATISGKVVSVDGANGKLVVVYGTHPDDVLNLADGTVVKTGLAANDVYAYEIADLLPPQVYYYAVGIVAGGQVVASRKGAFLSSDDVVAFLGGNGEKASSVDNWLGLERVSTETLNGKSVIIAAACDWDVNFDSNDPNRIGELTVALADDEAVTVNQGLRITGDLTLKSGKVVFGISTDYIVYANLNMNGGEFTMPTGRLNFSDDAQVAKYQIHGGKFTVKDEVNTGDVEFPNTILTATTFTYGNGSLTGRATRFQTENIPVHVNGYGLWDSPKDFFNMIPGLVERGIVPTSCGFAFPVGAEGATKTVDEIFADLFETGCIKVNGEALTREAFDADFTVINTATKQLVTQVTPFNAQTKGEYTLMNGAVVRLAEAVSLEGLTMKGSESIVDLAGKRLKVPAKSLRINGETFAVGEYTAATLPAQIIDTVGGGKLVASDPKSGLMLIIR